MLAGMDPYAPVRLAELAEQAENKLPLGVGLTRPEQLALLAKLLARQETRLERKYAPTGDAPPPGISPA